MRTKKTFTNVKYLLFFFFINTLLSFVSRKVFLDALGPEYLGYTSLIQNLLQYLNLTELGLGAAISYALYKPLYDKDYSAINDIITFYAQLMKIIGYAILIIGTILCFLIPVLAKDEIDTGIALIYFFAYVIYTMINFTTTYRQIVIQTDQKQYVLTKISGINRFLKSLVLIVLLYHTKSFILWFLIGLVFDIFAITVANGKAFRMYPWLTLSKPLSLRESFNKYRDIFSNISTTFLYKIGNIIIFQTDNILMAVFASLTTLGIVANYTMITITVSTFLTNIIWMVKPGIGNLVVENNDEKSYAVWREFFSLSLYIAAVCSFCMYELIDRFILVWLNNSAMILDKIFVIAFVVNFFFKISREPVEVFKTSYGLFKNDKLNTVYEFTGNFLISVALGYWLGPVGVLLGTSVAYILTSFWTRPKLLFTQGFKKPLRLYFSIYFIQITIVAIGIFLSHEIAHNYIFTLHIQRPIFRFLTHAALVFGSSSLILLALFLPDKYFRNFFKRIQSVYHR